MDFPVCPSCGQSVIDDDVDDCPFCGSSMKAKPGAKPSPKPAAAKPAASKPAEKPAAGAKPPAGKPAVPGRPGTKPGPADDFPFEAEVPGAKTAVQAMPNPSKGRSVQVVCPMCETEGYIPPTAVGKDVKCANSKCMVPIFKAPAPKVETAPEPTPKKKSNIVVVGGVTVAVVGVIGAAAVFVPGMLAQKPKPGVMSEEDKALLSQSSTPTKPPKTETPAETKTDVPATDVKPTEKGVTDELLASVVKQLNDAALMNQPKQRSKPVCRQLAAEACVRLGDLKTAGEHLSQLEIVGANVPYYRIEPGVALFWLNWETDKANAGKNLDLALEDARKLPKIGRHQMEVAGRLAAALVAAGRVKEAQELLQSHQSAENDGQLAAQTQLSSDGRLTRLNRTQAVLPWSRPQAAAATGSLVAHNQLAAAKSWAEAQTDNEAKGECFAIWAEGIAFHQSKPGPANSSPEIEEATKGLSAALKARVWARAACGRYVAGDAPGAAETLKLAVAELAKVAVPPEPEMPSVKTTVNYKLPDDAPLVHAATAAAEIAYVQTLWPDQKAQAEATLDLSLGFARGLAPAWGAVNDRQNQAEQAGLPGLREMLKREMSLKNDDQANQNAVKYRKVLTDMKSAAQRRFVLQALTMSRLAEVGLKDKVWTVVNDRSTESNISRRDDFLGTALVGELIELFRGTDTEKVIQAAVGGAQIVRPDLAVVRELVQQNPAQAAEYVSKLPAENSPRDEIVLTVATSLAAEGNSDAVFAFISKLTDPVLREDAYRLSAALLAQHGKVDAVWKQVAIAQQATEKASLCRSLIVGVKSGPPQKDLR
ncbi:MAG: hypothetical protein U0941_25490 [Planctomycetaceae bacterium]